MGGAVSYPLVDDLMRVSCAHAPKRGEYLSVPRSLRKQYWRETLTREIEMRQAELAKLDRDDPNPADPIYSSTGISFNGVPLVFEDVDKVQMRWREVAL